MEEKIKALEEQLEQAKEMFNSYRGSCTIFGAASFSYYEGLKDGLEKAINLLKV